MTSSLNNSITRFFLVAMATFAIGLSVNVTPVIADDTDVYIDPNPPDELAEPLVMFNFDYTPSGTSTVCTNTDGATDGASLVALCSGQGITDEDVAQAMIDLNYHDNNGVNGNIDLFESVMAAVIVVVREVTGIKIGLMTSHNHENNCNGPNGDDTGNCSNGGYIMRGFESLSSTTSKNEFIDILENLPQANTGSATHPLQAYEAYAELYRYLTGQLVYNGHNGFTDYGTDNTQNLNVDTPQSDWDASIEILSNTTYVSPYDTLANECAEIYVVNLFFSSLSTSGQDSNAANNSGVDDRTILTDTIINGGMEMTLTGSTANDNFTDTVDYVFTTDLIPDTGAAPANIPVEIDGIQNITSYFLVDANTENQGNTWAAAGGTDTAVVVENPSDAVAFLTATFDEILSVSTTFVAPSVPVDAFNRSQVANELFLALFDPDEDRTPFWPGNLKKLNIDFDTLELQAQGGTQAIDPADGRLKRNILTIWTDSTDPRLATASEDADAGFDGRDVARGGAGQQMPGYLDGDPGTANGTGTDGKRVIYYAEDESTNDPDLLDLNVDTTTAAENLFDEIARDMVPFPNDGDMMSPTDVTAFADAQTSDQDRMMAILEWVRGFVGDNDTTAGNVRDWWLGDPLHSRPLTINYGARASWTTSNPDIRIVFGTNDGLFHMFQNTQSSGFPAGTDTDGYENWAFAPRETMPIWDRLHQNTPGDPLHPITVDGPPVSYTNDINEDGTLNGSDDVWVFFGLRRGGKSYYALDISDPDNPDFKWRIGKYDDPLVAGTSGTPTLSSDFPELAMTFSTPVVGEMNINGTTTPVLVFGGGYNGDDGGDDVVDDDANANYLDDTDTNGNGGLLGKDTANRQFNADVTVDPGEDDVTANIKEGNAIYVVNADTGALIWKATNSGADTASLEPVTDMVDSIPSEVAAVDTTGNRLLDRIYTGDTGGRVWRVDMADSNPVNWTVTEIFDAGRHITDDVENDRRFFNRPAIVQTFDDTGPYDAVLIGSGDRENPNGTNNIDYFFMIKDRAINSGSPSATGFTHTDNSGTVTSSLEDATTNADPTNGWYLKLNVENDDTGQKNLSTALVLGGIVFFSTFAPVQATCGLSEGEGRQFAVGLQTGDAAFNFDDSNDGSYELYDDLESGGIPTEPVSLGDDILLFPGQGGNGGGGDDDDDDDTIENLRAIGVRTTWTTYWYEVDY